MITASSYIALHGMGYSIVPLLWPQVKPRTQEFQTVSVILKYAPVIASGHTSGFSLHARDLAPSSFLRADAICYFNSSVYMYM